MTSILNQKQIILVGISERTSNKLELDPKTSVIIPTLQRYWRDQIASHIQNRIAAGTTYCCYTRYDSDHTGPYTYFIGEAVTDASSIPDGYDTITILEGKYSKITAGPGLMPSIVIQAWHKIWAMSEQELGGKRSYQTDYELYDKRSQQGDASVVDIFIGIK